MAKAFRTIKLLFGKWGLETCQISGMSYQPYIKENLSGINFTKRVLQIKYQPGIRVSGNKNNQALTWLCGFKKSIKYLYSCKLLAGFKQFQNEWSMLTIKSKKTHVCFILILFVNFFVLCLKNYIKK
jgi:hypothetical protein